MVTRSLNTDGSLGHDSTQYIYPTDLDTAACFRDMRYIVNRLYDDTFVPWYVPHVPLTVFDQVTFNCMLGNTNALQMSDLRTVLGFCHSSKAGMQMPAYPVYALIFEWMVALVATVSVKLQLCHELRVGLIRLCMTCSYPRGVGVNVQRGTLRGGKLVSAACG